MSQYSLTYNGLTLDPSNGYTVYLQDGVSGAPVRISVDVLTGQDGGVVNASKLGPRNIILQGTVHTGDPTTFFERRRELLRAFSTAKLLNSLSITFWDGQTFMTEAAVSTTPQIIDRTGKRTQIDFRVEMVAPDPFFRVGSKIVETAVAAPGGVGFPLPAPLPMPLGVQLAGSTIVINNQGDVPVIPSFRLDGQLQNPVVTNLTTGQSFRITTNIDNGRYVDIFKQNGDDYVLLDGTTSWYQNFVGDIFPIVLGNNAIRLSATTSDLDGLLTITYQDWRNGV